jgi:hypothetical protein
MSISVIGVLIVVLLPTVSTCMTVNCVMSHRFVATVTTAPFAYIVTTVLIPFFSLTAKTAKIALCVQT